VRSRISARAATARGSRQGCGPRVRPGHTGRRGPLARGRTWQKRHPCVTLATGQPDAVYANLWADPGVLEPGREPERRSVSSRCAQTLNSSRVRSAARFSRALPLHTSGDQGPRMFWI